MARGGWDETGQAHLGRAIKDLRQRAGVTQTQLGRHARLHQTWVSHIEAGKVNITWGNLRRIAYALGIRLEELIALAERYEAGQALRDSRRQCGLTQTAFAERIGLSVKRVSSIERGLAEPSEREKAKLRKELGSIGGAGKKKTSPVPICRGATRGQRVDSCS